MPKRNRKVEIKNPRSHPEEYEDLLNRLPDCHVLCPICRMPASVNTVRGITRYHKCNGYQDDSDVWSGCGHTFKSVNWKVRCAVVIASFLGTTAVLSLVAHGIA